MTTMFCKTKAYALLLLFLFSCSHKTIDLKVSGTVQYNIPLRSEVRDNIKKIDALFDSIQLIYLKTPDTFLIASVNKVILFQNKIFVLDKKFSTVTCFDKNGNFLLKYGSVGLSKNEYKKADDFNIDSAKNELIIFSNENKCLYSYSVNNGNFIRKRNTGLFASSFCLLPDDEILLYIDNKIDSDDDSDKKNYGNNIVVIDSNSNITKRFLPFNFNISSIGWSLMTGFLTSSNNRIFFSDAFSDTVFFYKGGEIFAYSYIDVNSDSIQKNRLDSKKIFMSGLLLDSSSSFLKTRFFANSDYIIFDYQSKKMIKNAIYKIADSSLHILSQESVIDPLLALTGSIVHLDADDNVLFSISSDDILNLKVKSQPTYNRLPDTIKAIFKNVDSMSNFYLLRAHFKP